MKRVLITGGRAPVAVDLARRLAEGGAQVWVADSAPCFVARGSRAVFKSVRVPPPRQEPRAFATAIRDVARQERIDLIVPTCEEVFYLGRYAAELRPVAALFCADFSLLSELHDKWRFTRLANGLGVEVPETWRLRTPDERTRFVEEAQEWVFKPVFSRFAVHTLVRPTAEALSVMEPSTTRPWVAQRFVEGRELCSYAVACEGRLTAHALYQPTWRAGRGSGYYFQPERREAIEAFTSRLVEKTGYTGQIAFDFIEAPDGRVHVIECNPRATSGLHLFGREDRLANAFDGSTREVIRPRNERAAMLAAAMVFIGTVDATRRWRWGRWAVDWWKARDVLWTWRDPWPAFYVFAGLAAVLVSAFRRGISPQAASTGDIEWDGEEIPGP